MQHLSFYFPINVSFLFSAQCLSVDGLANEHYIPDENVNATVSGVSWYFNVSNLRRKKKAEKDETAPKTADFESEVEKMERELDESQRAREEMDNQRENFFPADTEIIIDIDVTLLEDTDPVEVHCNRNLNCSSSWFVSLIKSHQIS